MTGPFSCNDNRGLSVPLDHKDFTDYQRGGFPDDVELVPFDTIVTNYGILWCTIEKLFPELDPIIHQKILSLVVNTCGHCKEQTIPCYCHRDD